MYLIIPVFNLFKTSSKTSSTSGQIVQNARHTNRTLTAHAKYTNNNHKATLEKNETNCFANIITTQFKFILHSQLVVCRKRSCARVFDFRVCMSALNFRPFALPQTSRVSVSLCDAPTPSPPPLLQPKTNEWFFCWLRTTRQKIDIGASVHHRPPGLLVAHLDWSSPDQHSRGHQTTFSRPPEIHQRHRFADSSPSDLSRRYSKHLHYWIMFFFILTGHLYVL